MRRANYRFRLAAVCLGLVTFTFLQEPGRIAADTKLDLTQNPWGFLERALHMWDDSAFFGQLQNQAYGYFWPVGPFFGVVDWAGVVPWVAQRLWWSIVLVVGFLGVVRLVRVLGVGSPLSRVLAGLSYVLSARMLSELSTVSVEAWPMALAPWVLIPLVLGSRTGSPRRWGLVSAVAFWATGAVNAVASIAILPVPAIYLATRARGPRRTALTVWWVLGTALASLWWVVPLLLLGRYSPPFLDWIEAAAITTGQNDPTSVLRGASHWIPFLVDAEGPVWPAGWELVSSAPAVAATGALALAGLAGLLTRRIPERAFLVLTLCAGLSLTVMGHISRSGLSGVGASELRVLLDGGLAPLRNVHKFQPLVSLTLAVGLAHLIGLGDRAARVRSVLGGVAKPALVGSIVVALGFAATPLLSGRLIGGRSYAEIPSYWRETAAWLSSQDDGRALVVPASSFGTYMWGRTQDEPLQVLDSGSWAVRDAVPLSSAGNIRLLDEVERLLSSGTGSPGLAPALARAGVGWVVVRNDLNTRASRAALPVLVHQALQASPGLSLSRSFGPILSTFDSTERIVDGGLLRAYPAVEVYRVAGDPRTVDGKAALRFAASVVEFTGASEALLDLADSGLLRDRPAITAGDAAPPTSRIASVLTDTYRRAEANFGAAQRQYSNTLRDVDEFISDRPVHDYYHVDPTGRLTEARLAGAVDVTASSSGSSPFALRGRSPASQPWSALDGDTQTAWISGDLAKGVGQWWEVSLDRPVSANSAAVRFVGDARVGSPPAVVRVATDRGTREVELDPSLDVHTLPLPEGGPTNRLRIELVAVREPGVGQGFGIAEVAVPGLAVERPAVTAPAAADGGIVLAGRSMGRESCAAADTAIVCDPDLADPGEDRAGVDRVVDVGVGGEYRVVTRVRPRPGTALDAYLAAPPNAVTVSSSSQSASDPAVRAQAAADQNTRTTWIASPLDQEPTLDISLPSRQRVTGLLLQTAGDAPASRPLEVEVEVNGITLTLYTDTDGRLTLPEIRTDRIRLTFGTVSPVRSIDSGTGASVLLPVGVTELHVLGAEDRRMLQKESAPVSIPCGFGPQVRVDDQAPVSTRVQATVGGILEGALARGESCDRTVTLTPGIHRIRVAPTEEWTVERVFLVPLEQPTPAAERELPLPKIVSWSETERVVHVTAADEPQLLETTENHNAGWTASVGGEDLAAYRVDGWRQAFLVPAGVGGDVTLHFAPDRPYRAGLLAGLVASLLLIVMAVWPTRRPSRLPAVEPMELRRTSSWLPVGTALLVGGAWGLAAAVLVIGAALLVARRQGTAAAGLRVARILGLLGAAASLGAQAAWPWPGRAAGGYAFEALLIAGPAMALAALACATTRRLGAPTGRSAAPEPPN